MTSQVLSSREQISSEWLTQVLIRSGALTNGEVAAVEINADDRRLSSIYRLRIAYSEKSDGAKPTYLFLKTVNADQDDDFFGPSEVTYYVRDYVGVDGAPLIRCYDGVFSAEQRRYHLLLDDLSDSHVEAGTKTPTLAYLSLIHI